MGGAEILHGGATFPRKFGMGVPNLGGGGGAKSGLPCLSSAVH